MKKRRYEKGNKKQIINYALILIILIIILFLLLNFKITGFVTNELEKIFSRPQGPLLDIRLYIEDKGLYPGDNLILTIKMINVGLNEVKDAILEYSIVNEETGEELYKTTETIAVQTSLDIVRKVYLFENIKPGNYKITVKSTYHGDEQKELYAESSSHFTVLKDFKGLIPFEYALYVLIFVLLIISIMLYQIINILTNRNKRSFSKTDVRKH